MPLIHTGPVTIESMAQDIADLRELVYFLTYNRTLTEAQEEARDRIHMAHQDCVLKKFDGEGYEIALDKSDENRLGQRGLSLVERRIARDAEATEWTRNVASDGYPT